MDLFERMISMKIFSLKRNNKGKYYIRNNEKSEDLNYYCEDNIVGSSWDVKTQQNNVRHARNSVENR